MPIRPTDSDAPYLCRPLRVVLVPAARAGDVRDVLLAGGVALLPAERSAARTQVIELSDHADIDRAASLLRDYEGWPN